MQNFFQKKIRPGIRDSNNLLVVTIPPKTATSFLETVAQQWFETSYELHNFTINPYLKHKTRLQQNGHHLTFGQLSDDQILRMSKAELKKLIGKGPPLIKDTCVGFYLCPEYGDNNGKFHLNLSVAFHAATSEKVGYWLKDKLKQIFGTTQYSIKHTYHSKWMKKPDVYQMKDATFMSSLSKTSLYCLLPEKPIETDINDYIKKYNIDINKLIKPLKKINI